MKTFLTQFSIVLISLMVNPYWGFTQDYWKSTCGTFQTPSTSTFQPDTVVNGDSVIIVPTVFHIINMGGAENISKTHVLRALQILNRDFNRQNPDTFDIPAAFHPLRGNPKIEFRLARIDPSGNCTDGIDRIYSPLTGSYNNAVQMYSNFAWNHTQYMNIYVVNFISFVQGPMFPGLSFLATIDSSQTVPDDNDLLMMTYNDLGDGMGGVASSSRGHLLTEEMAHNLGLYHTFGSGAGCGDDDYVADTPLQDDENRGCPSFPQISCNNGPDGDMFNNFLDYAKCKNMFTEGQVDRMRTCLAYNKWRDSLWIPSNLTATGVDIPLPLCQTPPVADFGYGNFAGWHCAGTPIQFYEAASINATSYQWEFPGANPATSTDTFPSVIFPDSGFYNVKLIVSNTFGIDTVVKSIRIEPAEVFYSAPFIESFEDTSFNKQIASWTLLGKEWSVTNAAAFTGDNSIFLDSSLNHISAFFTHIFDMNQLTGTGRTLDFKVAFGMSASGAAIDGGLRVIWKRPCAYERMELHADTSLGVDANVLNTGNGIFPGVLQTVVTNNPFVPVDTSQWKTITLPIPDNLTGEIQIGFTWYNFTPTTKFKGMYIDDIKLNNPTGISENTVIMNWNIFPNPATDQLTIALGNENSKFDLVITDITGKIIYSETLNKSSGVTVNTSDFPKGVYLVRMTSGDNTSTKKLIIQ